MKVNHARITLPLDLVVGLFTEENVTICKTTKGLPRNAKIVRVDYESTGMIYLVFEHPFFDAVEFGTTPPTLVIDICDYNKVTLGMIVQVLDAE